MRPSARLAPPLLALWLAACGSGESDERPAPATAPDAAPSLAPVDPGPPVGQDRSPASEAGGAVPGPSGILPLASILPIAQARTAGEVIEVELDDEDDDDPTYEITILTPEGRTIETVIDARSGAILELEED